MKATKEYPLIHFENLVNLIQYGVQGGGGDEYKDHEEFFKTCENYKNHFFKPKTDLRVVAYDISKANEIAESPIALSWYEDFKCNNWINIISNQNLRADVFRSPTFIQLEFNESYKILNSAEQLMDMIYAVGVFIRPIIIDDRLKLILGYGVLHKSGKNSKAIDYDLMSKMYLISIIDKTVKISLIDGDCVVLDENAEPIEFENYIFTHIFNFACLENSKIKHNFIEGILQSV